MAGLFPLVALTLLATASFSGPVSTLFRTIRRVVQPGVGHPELPPGDTAPVKPANPLHETFLHVFTSLFASIRIHSGPRAILPVFRGQDNSGTSLLANGSSTCEGNALSDAEISKVDAGEVDLVPVAVEDGEESDGDADATTIRISPPPYTRQPAPRVPLQPRAYFDFAIAWDDIWPEVPSPRVTYTYNSYFNAYTATRAPPPHPDPVFYPSDPPPSGPSAHSDDDDDDDDDTDSEIDSALELASHSADDDLLWALHSLSLSESSPSTPPSYPELSPQAGMSPFCPPPPRIPSPSPPPGQQSTTWRLEWY